MFFFSLYKSLQNAKLAGWENITLDIISLKELRPGVTKLIAPRTRGNLTRKTMFFKIISPNFLDLVVAATNAQAAKAHENTQGPTPKFTRDDIVGYIQMIILACATGAQKWNEFVRNKERVGGLAQRKMESLTKYFSYTPEEICPSFNEGLQSVVAVIS